MFWKRKKAAEPDPLFRYEGSCRREYARVHPSADRPVEVRLGGRPTEAVDLSAGGLAFRSGEARPGEILSLEMYLPDGTVIRGSLEVLAVDADGLSHGRFLELTGPMIEALHRYALEVQKETLRAEKARGGGVGARPAGSERG